MAKMSLRGFFNIIESKTYARFEAPASVIYNEIIGELRRNNITCHASIERTPFRYQRVESDGLVLFLSERGLFTLFVTICSLGSYSQVQVITRNVARKYSFEDPTHSMEHSMHNLYKNAVSSCISKTIDRIATTNNWSCLGNESNEIEVQ